MDQSPADLAPMIHTLASTGFRLFGRPCFRIHGKGRRERHWRSIDVYASRRRDQDSPWPPYFFRGTCITWTRSVIAVGWDFALEVLREQASEPASREQPVAVAGGRLRDVRRRTLAAGEAFASASEILAHECGHTWQAGRLGWLYWPVGAAFTLCREGPRWYNAFENRASEEGLFGGIVNGSVCPELMAQLLKK
jgi:hypothetical protein